MSLFFVLSGFIIHYNYGEKIAEHGKTGIHDFLAARFARLYPLFLALFVFDFACGNFMYLASSDKQGVYLSFLPYVLSMTQSWWLFEADGVSVNVPYQYSVVAWSVSTEVALYLLYLFVARRLFGYRNRQVLIIMTMVWTGATGIGLTLLKSNYAAVDAWMSSVTGFSWVDPSFTNWFWYFSPYGRFPEFLTGCFVAQLYILIRNQAPSRRERMLGVAMMAGASVFLFVKLVPQAVMYLPGSIHIYNMPHTVGIATLIFCIVRHHGVVRRFLEWRPVVEIGEASYSVYMLHMIVVTALIVPTFMEQGLPQWLAVAGRFILLAAFVAMLSLGSYRYFEVPARKWLRAKLSLRPQFIKPDDPSHPSLGPETSNTSIGAQVTPSQFSQATP